VRDRSWIRPALVGEDGDRVGRCIGWLASQPAKFYGWRERYGKATSTTLIPPGFWLEQWEKGAIIHFHLKNPLEGYRR